MICPNCGIVASSIPTPFLTKSGVTQKLGVCKNCNYIIWAKGTTKTSESSKEETVESGESREELLADICLAYSYADSHQKSNEIDIDRVFLKGKINYK